MNHYPGIWYTPHQGWQLTEPLPVLIMEGRFTIPKGFKSDLASIPRLLRVIPGMDCYECGVRAHHPRLGISDRRAGIR